MNKDLLSGKLYGRVMNFNSGSVWELVKDGIHAVSVLRIGIETKTQRRQVELPMSFADVDCTLWGVSGDYFNESF